MYRLKIISPKQLLRLYLRILTDMGLSTSRSIHIVLIFLIPSLNQTPYDSQLFYISFIHLRFLSNTYYVFIFVCKAIQKMRYYLNFIKKIYRKVFFFFF